ncbi:hypothetical protein FOXB_12185 [Fusarium oxysporum f. sp. conglutinans Fo5176]|uniref:NAD(P)-binding domain-containing protein n=1 Tax=Fusarium oxysporum (strain Fo5176) TaxID=660025 RepID=F9G0K3_FUSOF|nr:hypothetical protein FOXB_12185 [Fusarium oxysporum f. sp. conglutinans Fo5176]
MVKVAVAGGSGVLGRSLVDVLANQSKHEGIILTRKASDVDLGLPSFVVDYDDVASLTKFLDENKVDTIISAFGINGTSLSRSQNNLIKAADASSVTRRFIPSSFAIKYPEDGLEWAVVHNGTFLDYFFPPSGIKTYYNHGTLVVDMLNNSAAIPGTGDEVLAFTYTFDVAKFVIAAVDLESWPAELRIIGTRLTFNELIELAEKAKGKKFTVTYDNLDKLRRFEISELPGHEKDYPKFPKEVLLPFLSIFERWMAEGHGDLEYGGSLNEMFPDIETLTAQELMEVYWKAG